ncbi:MAG: patatin-like phospholipase family protein, partial [Opitutales bacterium]|nr:patatin-like phospholipase family protein [Opitutales bacterium]
APVIKPYEQPTTSLEKQWDTMHSREVSESIHNEGQKLLEKAAQMSSEEGRKLRLNWDHFIIKLQQGKSLSKKEAKSQLNQLPNIFIAKVQPLELPNTDDFIAQIGKMKQDFDGLIAFLHSKAYKASSRTKILTIDSFLTMKIGGLEEEIHPTANVGNAQTAPTLFVSIDRESNRPLYHLARPAPLIRNLCLRGGGGKGQGYVKMIDVLRKKGLLDSLEHVAGTSAGGIAAAALAFGIEDLDQFCSEIQASVMSKRSKAALKAMPFLKSKFHGIGILGSAAGVISAIDRIIIDRVQEFLNRDEIKTLVPQMVSGEELKRLERLRTRKTTAHSEEDFMTFADHALLRRVATAAGLKNKFLDLTLAFWNATRQKEEFFNAKTYPGIPIPYGVRATMALPGAFQCITLVLDGQKCKIQDGAIGSNSPTEVFFAEKPGDHATEMEKLAYQKIQSETLTCIFDEQGGGFSAESSRYNYGEGKGTSFFLKLLGTVKSARQVKKLRDDENKKLDLVGNVIVVPHGDLGVLNMNPTSKQKAAADMMSELAANAWCANRARERADISSFSLESLIREMPWHEREQVDDASWREVLRAFIFIRRTILSSIAEELRSGSIPREELRGTIDRLQENASGPLRDDQQTFLDGMYSFELWELLTIKGRQIFCEELKKGFNLS